MGKGIGGCSFPTISGSYTGSLGIRVPPPSTLGPRSLEAAWTFWRHQIVQQSHSEGDSSGAPDGQGSGRESGPDPCAGRAATQEAEGVTRSPRAGGTRGDRAGRPERPSRGHVPARPPTPLTAGGRGGGGAGQAREDATWFLRRIFSAARSRQGWRRLGGTPQAGRRSTELHRASSTAGSLAASAQRGRFATHAAADAATLPAASRGRLARATQDRSL